MSYYTTLNCFDFKSPLNEKELQAAFKEFMEKECDESEREALEIYEFSEIGGSPENEYEHELSMGEYHTQHDALDKLAEFVSTVIAPGEYVIIEETDLGVENGYKAAVIKGEVKPFSYIRYCDEGQTLDTWLLSKDIEA